ncbi:ATP-binding protein [Chloroflexota bacterium]
MPAPENTPADRGNLAADDEQWLRTCPICGGSRWVAADVPLGHPDFGKALPCDCMTREFEQGRHTRLEHYSNLGALTRLTFDNLLPSGRSTEPQDQEQFARAYQAAQQFAAEPKGWLVLSGPSGCGKTHLAAALANQQLSAGRSVLFAVVADLLDHLRTTFSPGSYVGYDELFEQVRNDPVLVLDDLGGQSSTPWAQEKLFQILNHRFNAQLPTVITTMEVELLDERLRTRLNNSALVQHYVLHREQPALFRQIGGLTQEHLVRMTFDNFDSRGLNADEEQQQRLQVALESAKLFARQPQDWLLFTGPNGCGKTHLAAAIANQQLAAGRRVFFAVVPDLLDRLRATFSPESKVTYFDEFEEIKTHPLLILDDLGTEMGTPWAQEKLYQIVNYRYNSRLPMVVTTSSLPEDLEGRLRSRLNDVKLTNVVPIIAPDYRGQTRVSRRSAPPHSPRRGRWAT